MLNIMNIDPSTFTLHAYPIVRFENVETFQLCSPDNIG